MATAIHQYEDKLLDFAYGELPAPEASAVESHLKSCPRCSQALEQIRGVRVTMGALAQEPAPAAGLESLLAYAGQAAARNADAQRPAVPWWRRMVAPLAGACALALVAVVAVKTQDDVDFSKESAALETERARAEEKVAKGEASAPAPAEVAAAPVAAPPRPEPAQEPLEPQKVAQRMKTGKVAGAMAGAEADRQAKEQRAWDANKKDALAKNNEGYQQELGATKGPAGERQQAQREDLGSAVAAASKESKSRREADYRNARGGYAPNKLAEESARKEKEANADELAYAFGDGAKDKTQAPAPLGLSTAAPSAAPPAPSAKPMAKAAPPPPQVAANEPAVQQAQPSSLGLSMNAGVGSGSVRSSPSGYKQGTRDSLDDDSGGRVANQVADSKRPSNDAEAEQRSLEAVARQHLDAARSAANQSNHQEEVKQALAALATNVKGAARAEALNRLCSALEELGSEGQADKYCDALLREFPTSNFAKQVATRRNNLQRAKKSPAHAYDSESEKKVEPAKAKPADQDKPAAAY